MTPPPAPLPPWLPIAILVAFPIFFIPFWCGICFLLSTLSGWRRVAEKYPGSATPAGTRFPVISGSVGLVAYRNCLKIHVAPEGLHIAVWKIFGVGHRPLFIPWSEIHHAKVRKFFFLENVVFEIGAPKVAKVQLPKKIFLGQPLPLAP